MSAAQGRPPLLTPQQYAEAFRRGYATERLRKEAQRLAALLILWEAEDRRAADRITKAARLRSVDAVTAARSVLASLPAEPAHVVTARREALLAETSGAYRRAS